MFLIKGEISYKKYEEFEDKNIICIFDINILPDYQNEGIYSEFIKYLISIPHINQIFVAMLSTHKIEYTTAKNYYDNNYWINQGGDCIWCRHEEDKKNYTGYIIDPERLEYIKSKI
jgi:hypothetical protein